jgi:hypothetical protein
MNSHLRCSRRSRISFEGSTKTSDTVGGDVDARRRMTTERLHVLDDVAMKQTNDSED